MKCIILCSGYATRLYPLTLNKPKSLLPVGGKPLLNYLAESVSKLEDIDKIIIVSNDKFYGQFLEWKNSVNFGKEIKILNDGTSSNETRLGGIGDFWFAIEREKINDDILLLLGDNFFDFDLGKIVEMFEKNGKCAIGLYDVRDANQARNFGVIKLRGNRVVSFDEKPENPKSTLISTGIYLFPRSKLGEIKEYMKTGKPKDGPGYLIKDFINNGKVYGLALNGFWHDIGTKEIYEEVNKNANHTGN